MASLLAAVLREDGAQIDTGGQKSKHVVMMGAWRPQIILVVLLAICSFRISSAFMTGSGLLLRARVGNGPSRPGQPHAHAFTARKTRKGQEGEGRVRMSDDAFAALSGCLFVRRLRATECA